MRHKKKGRKLGRKSGNRKALLMNLTCQLITHKKIKTTDPKAKEIRSYIEPLNNCILYKSPTPRDRG